MADDPRPPDEYEQVGWRNGVGSYVPKWGNERDADYEASDDWEPVYRWAESAREGNMDAERSPTTRERLAIDITAHLEWAGVPMVTELVDLLAEKVIYRDDISGICAAYIGWLTPEDDSDTQTPPESDSARRAT